MDGRELETKVLRRLEEAGFPAESQPRLGLLSRRRADILLRHKKRTIAIEVKASRVGLTDILEVGKLPVDRAVIVVPIGVKQKIAASVLDYATQQKIEVYQEDELEDLVASLDAPIG